MGAFSRYLWLDARMSEAVHTLYRAGSPGWDDFLFARAAARDIQSLGDSGEGLYSAVLLAKAVADLLVRAHLAYAGAAVAPDTAGSVCWSRLLELPIASPVVSEFSRDQLEIIASVLSDEGTRYLTQQPLRRLRLVLSTMRDFAQGLLEPLETKATAVKKVRTQRWLRISALTLTAVIGASLLWKKAFERPNLAFGKTVTISQSDTQWVKDPRGLVDGNRNELGFHTISAANQTATIDLGSPQHISRVAVYNRTECCQDRAVPLRIDISEDGKSYRTIVTRNEPFQVSFTSDFPKAKARYVRLTNLKATYFHLNEVEVY